jgi:hypothetical protein
MGDSISMFTQHHGPIGDGIALLTGLCFCSWLLICEFSKRKPPAGRQLLWVGIVTACIDSRMQAQACSRPSVVISGYLLWAALIPCSVCIVLWSAVAGSSD